ncbi:hypothetical protein KJJ24_04835 [Synechococcus sp. LA31]|nr:hypothetical protein KJJ24_04835 [Synechococcus sp. LA31]
MVVAGLTLNNVLAILAASLLVFVSGGVIYLSTVEWRDRRRRQQLSAAPKPRPKTKSKALR